MGRLIQQVPRNPLNSNLLGNSNRHILTTQKKIPHFVSKQTEKRSKGFREKKSAEDV